MKHKIAPSTFALSGFGSTLLSGHRIRRSLSHLTQSLELAKILIPGYKAHLGERLTMHRYLLCPLSQTTAAGRSRCRTSAEQVTLARDCSTFPRDAHGMWKKKVKCTEFLTPVSYGVESTVPAGYQRCIIITFTPVEPTARLARLVCISISRCYWKS